MSETIHGWQKVKLSEICEIISGGTPKTSISEYWNGDIYWLSVKDFNNDNRFVYDTEKKITKIGLENSSTNLLQYGDIIISARGTVGELAMIPYDMAFNQSCYGLRAKGNIDCFFLYLVKDNLHVFRKNTHGSVFDTITKDTFGRINFILPPLQIQKKIAAVLSALDDKIELNNKINQNLEQQAQAIFKSWFMKQTNSERKKIKAEEFFDISIGKTPPRKEPEWFSSNSDDVIWISITDMGNCGAYISSSSEKIKSTAISKFNIKIVPDNTVILSFKLTVGRVAITDGEVTTNEAIAHFVTNKKKITEYLYCYLKNFNFQNMGSTSSIATAVNSKLIKAMPFVIPTEKELHEFHELVSPMFLKIKIKEKIFVFLSFGMRFFRN